MRVRLMAMSLVALAVATSAVIMKNYDRWFVYPELHAHVSSQMKDPASTQFRSEKLSPEGWLCGEMNAKNSYGAYSGFKRFISISEADAYVESMGRVGKSEDSSRQITESLDVQIEILKNRKVFNETVPASMQLQELSQKELESEAEKVIFNRRWDKTCT